MPNGDHQTVSDGRKSDDKNYHSVPIMRNHQEAAKNLVLQYRVERAARLMGIVGIILLIIVSIASIIAPFRPSHFYGV